MYVFAEMEGAEGAFHPPGLVCQMAVPFGVSLHDMPILRKRAIADTWLQWHDDGVRRVTAVRLKMQLDVTDDRSEVLGLTGRLVTRSGAIL